MSNKSKNQKLKKPVLQALALPLFGIFTISLPTHAQNYSLYGTPGTNTLRDPLVPGASYSLPGVPSALGAAPPPGSGAVPTPVIPGMTGASSLIPWTTGTAGNSFSVPTNTVVIPANQINQANNVIPLPLSNSAALPPGVMNAIIGGAIPRSPSTPGLDPGMLRPAGFSNASSVAGVGQSIMSAGLLTAVTPNGQLPNLLTGVMPAQRMLRQGSRDSGLPGSSDFGLPRANFGYYLAGTSVWVPKGASYTYNSGLGVRALSGTGQLGNQFPAQISFDSPHKGGLPGSQNTSDLYGIPMINPNKITTSAGGSVSSGPPAPLNTVATQ